tara:strand:- start:1512 stop:2954 length:1443 start_codon:yes stop_codon:yes gene_type:complete
MSDQKEKENLLKEINKSSFFYGEISDELKKDIDIAKALIKNIGSGGFDKIDPSFKTYKEIILLAYIKDSDSYNSNASNENYVPKEFINDVEIISAAVKAGWSFDKVPENLKKDKSILIATVENNPRTYEKLSDEQRNDEEILLAAMESKKGGSFYTPFKFASDELKSNRNVVLKVLSYNGYSLEHVQDNLKKDKEIVLEAVKQTGYSLQYAEENFRQDREIVMYAARDGASNYIDSSFKNDQEICLSLIKKNAGSIFWCDESLKKDKAFMIKAIEQNKFVTLEDPSLNSEPEIDKLIKQGKAITKLYCEELFGVIKSMVPDAEYLCFAWSGGGDSFGGYKLKAIKYPNQQVNEKALDESLIKIIEEIMYYSGVIEELELNINWVDVFTCRGGLVLALQPLKKSFQWQIGTNAVHDEYNKVGEEPYDHVVCTINLNEGYQGLSISGEGSEEVTDYDNVAEDEDVEPQYDTNYFDREVPVGD